MLTDYYKGAAKSKNRYEGGGYEGAAFVQASPVAEQMGAEGVRMSFAELVRRASAADASETCGFSGALQLERVTLRRIRAPLPAPATQVPWPSAMCESMTTATPM